ncbi:hypothetical protein [Priestia megaterium]|uniref:hypothetical protein n=1 Tax=Priestia megaterium TaxID=1404 RepID=UPI002E212321|nr:hypothetical protein [Priestia megaterium]MED4278750.1 hypothetical protein [Priestia megaterium]MED4318745.1 hypothetical protein [Priestia megaterium]
MAKGHLKALERVLRTTGIDVFNLGTGVGDIVIDLIKSYENITSQKTPYSFTCRRAGDIDKCYADATKAKEILD